MRVGSLSSPVDPDVLVRMVSVIGSKYPEFEITIEGDQLLFVVQDVGAGWQRPSPQEVAGPSATVAQASPPWPESPAPTPPAYLYSNEPIDLIKEMSCSWNCGRTFHRRLNLERHERVCELRESEETP